MNHLLNASQKQKNMNKFFITICLFGMGVFMMISPNATGQNYSLTLNGTSQYFWALGTSENFPGSAITVEAWIYPSNLTGTHTIAAKYGGSGQGFLFETSGTGLKGTVYLSASTTVTAGTLSTGMWHHVAMTWIAGGSITLYVNGISVGTSGTTSAGTYVSNNENLMIGDYSSNYWNGSIDEVRIWNDVRTATEIKANIYKEISSPTGDASLIAYYKLNETSGTTAANSSSTTGIDGTTILGPSWAPSAAFYQTGNALQFSRASSQYVNIPANASLNNAQFTVEFWIKVSGNSSSWDGILDHGRYNATSDWYFLMYQNSQTLIVGPSSGTEYYIGLGENTWHHVAQSHDGSTWKVYFDGEMVYSLARAYTNSTGNAITIGKNSFYFGSCTVDEIRIWSDVRTAQEIAEYMSRPLQGDESNLVAYYPCNNGGGTTLQDMSANSNNGTLTNSPSWVSSEAYNTWLNTSSTAWSTASNWGRGAAPGSGDNVGIAALSGGSAPAMSSAVTIQSLSVGSGVTVNISHTGTTTIGTNLVSQGTVTLASGLTSVTAGLHVLGGAFNINPSASLSVLNSPGFGSDFKTFYPNGLLTLKSDATGTGSIYLASAVTISGNTSVERYIAGWSDANHGWHFLSSPVSAQAISSFHTAGSGNDFYKYDEPTDMWINRTKSDGTLNTDFETNFTVGRGYLVANLTTSTKTFTGTLNNSSVSVTGLTKTGANTDHTGWNLIGNPFPCALQWGVGTWSLSNVTASSCQIWNEANASYSVISTNGYIPAMNGFMVHADVTNASLSIPLDARAHNSTNWYKSSESETNRIKLTAVDPDGKTAQETILAFDGRATGNYDPDFDSYYLSGFAPMFYSVSGSENYAMNTLPSLTEDLRIPLMFIRNGSTSFYIKAEGLQNLSPAYPVYLSDLKTGESHLMTADSDYWFTSSDGDDPARFLLHFKPLGLEDLQSAEGSVKVWNSGQTIYIRNPGKLKGTLTVASMTGSTVLQAAVSGETLQQLRHSLASGVYICTFSSQKVTSSSKIVITSL
jgi:hypothetical protein